MADVFGVPVVASKVFEASSRGAALFALSGLGLLKDLSDAPLSKGRAFKPNPAHFDAYQSARARQDALYKLLLGH